MEINKNTKFQLVKKNIPFPTRCCICGNIASGFIYYNVMCCDGCKHFFRRSLNVQELFKCKYDGNCDVMKGCKHFFRRSLNVQELFKCKYDGNCDVMKGMKVIKMCEFNGYSAFVLASILEP
uniref:Nuclear receptor domain-containing protein n=1 Tax=Meloidogyne floridensis TaxID=298350 RepID=A0A915NVC8_9BILA